MPKKKHPQTNSAAKTDRESPRQLRLPDSVWAALDRIADQHDRSTNKEILRVLRRFTEAHNPETCPQCAPEKPE